MVGSYPFGLGEATADAATQAAAAAAQPQYVDRYFDYTFDVTLTANQNLPDQSLIIGGDADFIIRAIVGTQTGAYKIRFRDNQGFYLSPGMVNNSNIMGTAQLPVPIWPELQIPRNGKLGIDLLDTSGAGNTIEIVFKGVKRYPLTR